MKTILLFTSSFPFGKQETFLENEIVHLSKQFHIHLLPSYYNQNDTAVRELPDHVTYSVPILPRRKVFWLLQSLLSWSHLRTELNELVFLIKTKRVTFRNLFKLLNSTTHLRVFRRRIQKEDLRRYDILYFYWCNATSTRLPDHLQNVFIRIHGGEINTRRHEGFIPYLSETTHTAHTYLPISNDAADMLLRANPEAHYETHRLGTFQNLSTNVEPAQEAQQIQLVSCSSLIDLKRVHLIVEALRDTSKPIAWTHFGDGPLLNTISALSQTLPETVSCEFKGRVSNAEVHLFYQETHVDLFVNVSSTEGVPVSIMEAMSYGIPAFATNVGGVRELVTDQTGYLVEKDFEPTELSRCIEGIRDQQEKRDASRRFWAKHYDGATNYRKLLELFNQRG